MRVKEVVTAEMETASSSITPTDAARRLRDLKIGAPPVWDDG